MTKASAALRLTVLPVAGGIAPGVVPGGVVGIGVGVADGAPVGGVMTSLGIPLPCAKS